MNGAFSVAQRFLRAALLLAVTSTAAASTQDAAAKPPPVAPDAAPACRPESECCRICDRGKACGNSCIRESYHCHKGRGCACNVEEVCP